VASFVIIDVACLLPLPLVGCGDEGNVDMLGLLFTLAPSGDEGGGTMGLVMWG